MPKILEIGLAVGAWGLSIMQLASHSPAGVFFVHSFRSKFCLCGGDQLYNTGLLGI